MGKFYGTDIQDVTKGRTPLFSFSHFLFKRIGMQFLFSFYSLIAKVGN